MQKVTFVYPIIRTDYIGKSLKTLHKYTKREDILVVVVDQSFEGMYDSSAANPYEQGIDLYIRMKNEGFSKAANEGIIHGLKWNTPYIAVVNDDTEFMYEGWLDDAISEFDTDPNILAVCPESPRVAGWGYGLEHGINIDLLPHKDVYTKEDIEYLKKGDYDAEEIQSRHPFTIPKTFPITKRGVVDGIAMWCPIFKREAFIELGLFEERFVWGGGEDYDMLARAYSCAFPIDRDECDPTFHRRMVSTMKSWVWHWWGQSKDVKEQLRPELFQGKEPWNDNGQLWGPSFDVWGHYKDENGVHKPIKRKLPVKY
jgi:GT2 family glycosyltransferase